MKRLLKLSLIIALTTLFACNKDEVIVEEDLAPVIALDSETDIYLVKIGKSLTVTLISTFFLGSSNQNM